MGGNAASQDRQVVSAFHHADDPPSGMGLGHVQDVPSHRLEVLDLQPEVADRVLGVRVEPGRDDHQLGPDPVGDLVEIRAKRRQVLAPRDPVRQRHVPREAQAPTPARLVFQAGPGIERVAMDREERDARVFVKNLLSAVAVVNVPIHDQDAGQPDALHGVRRPHGHAVEQAKAHRFGRPGVMARRPDRAKGPAIGPGDHRRDGLDDGARRQSTGKFRAGGDPGVRLDLPASSRFGLADRREDRERMDPAEFFVGRLADRSRRAPSIEPGPLQVTEDGGEPLGLLGVPLGRRVSDHPAVGEQHDHRGGLPHGSTGIEASASGEGRQQGRLGVVRRSARRFRRFTWNVGEERGPIG